MRFQVPQFIERETQIIGPLTLKQFAWLGLGGFIIFISFVILPVFGIVIVFLLIAPLSVALAFAKVNGVSMPNYILRLITFFIKPRKYKYKQ